MRAYNQKITTIYDTFFSVVANSIHYILYTDPDPDPVFSKKVMNPQPSKCHILKKIIYTYQIIVFNNFNLLKC
jgi:hypothetical protein